MKRIVSLMLILALTLAFAACSTEKEQTTTDPTAAPTAEATAEPEVTEAPTAAPTEAPSADPAIIEAAWAIAEKLGEVHEQKFDKAAADVQSNEYFSTVRFPSVTYPGERLCITLEKDENGNYKADAESVYVEPEEGAEERVSPDEITEKLKEFRLAEIRVTADDIRAHGCDAEIGSGEYKAAAANVYGEKLAEYYIGSLDEESPFHCYDIQCLGAEGDEDYADTFLVVMAFRVRDILPFSYLFSYGPTYDNGTRHPEHEGWLVGWTVVTVQLASDGSFTGNAVLNSAG